MNEQQRHNTETYLVPVLEAKIAKNEPEWVLDSYLQPCGTYGCVGGDVAIRMHRDDVDIVGKPYGGSWTHEIYSDLEIYTWALSDCFEQTFGFTALFESGIGDVFGVSCQGTLQERLGYVNLQLEKHNETI